MLSQASGEGEGSRQGTDYDPLDFQGEVAHYFRFGEILNDKVLIKSLDPPGWAWGPQPFGVDWTGTYPAITDPGLHDFTEEPATAPDLRRAWPRHARSLSA